MAKTGFTNQTRRADRILAGALMTLLFYGVAVARLTPPAEAASETGEPYRSAVAMHAAELAADAGQFNLAAALTQATQKGMNLDAACLAQAIYFEARGEGRLGQQAVAEVVIRRSQDRRFPGSICGVVFQGAERRSGCQFSFTCNGAGLKPKDLALWRRALQVAAYMLEGEGRNAGLTGRATHFHALNVAPVWADNMVLTAVIGNHAFYRFGPRPRSS